MGVWVGAGGGYRRFLSILSRAFRYSIYPACVSYCVIAREKYISIWPLTFFLTRIYIAQEKGYVRCEFREEALCAYN